MMMMMMMIMMIIIILTAISYPESSGFLVSG